MLPGVCHPPSTPSGSQTAFVSQPVRHPPSQEASPTTSSLLTTPFSGRPRPIPKVPRQVELAHVPEYDTEGHGGFRASPKAPPQKRTRAVAAAAALDKAPAVASGSGTERETVIKKRKVGKHTMGAGETGSAVDPHDQTPIASGSRTGVFKQAGRPSPAGAPGPPQCDDADGHYIINKGDVLNGHYRVLRKLGEGTYGKVVKAVSQIDNKAYAVKIIRARQSYRDASTNEIKVLNELRRGDPKNVYKCIHLEEFFDHRNHVCLVFELLGESVFDFLEGNSFAPFPMAHIQDFGRQLITSVAYLHRLGIVHTDLKPENILLADSSSQVLPGKTGGAKQMLLIDPDIRLIDFGTATYDRDYHSDMVSTRHYRAPEVLLGLGWSFPCDMFSVGCILIEFFTGEALFQTKDNHEHLAMMERVMGKMPVDFQRKAARQKPKFFRDGKLDYPNATTKKESKHILQQMKTLRAIIPAINVEQLRFRSLIEQLLHFDPAERLSAADALKHVFFDVDISVGPLKRIA